MTNIVPFPSGAVSPFDAIREVRDDGTEFWSARVLMPLLGYVRKHVNPDDDLIKIGTWGELHGLTRPKTFELLRSRRIIYRDNNGELHAYADYRHLFVSRAHHDVPKMVNGQVRTTLYVKAFHVDELDRVAGVAS